MNATTTSRTPTAWLPRLLLACAALGLTGQPVAATINGNVTDATAQPIAGVQVSVYGQSGAAWQVLDAVLTDAAGGYAITDLADGNYRLYVNDPDGDYAAEWHADALSLADADDIVLIPAQPSAVSDFQLADAGRIQGHITDTGGTDLAGIRATAYRDAAGSWIEQAGSYSGADGSYRIAGLPAGSYRIGFLDPSGSYASEYHLDAADLASGQTLIIAVGDTEPGIDAELAANLSLQGQITNASANPLADIFVSAYRQDAGVWAPVAFTQSDAGGAFSLATLPAGTYRLRCIDSTGGYLETWYQNASTLDTAVDITLATGDPAPDLSVIMLSDTPVADFCHECLPSWSGWRAILQ